MKTPIEEPLATGEPFAGTVALSENAVTQRDALCKDAETLTAVSDDASLESAVAYLQDIGSLLKITEESRKKEKRPHIDYNKSVDDFAAKFAAPLERVKNRLTGLVNNWQRKQLEEKQARDREAQKKIEDARKLAEQAARDLAKATTPAATLAAQLKQETAALSAQSASATLAAPTNTPRGLVTRVRWDFEITGPYDFIRELPMFRHYDKANEIIKIDRAGLLKSLNGDSESQTRNLLPEEPMQSVMHAKLGIRVFRDIRNSTRS